ncbi:nucleotide pyrophosphohydrolase [Desulfovibrio desulfuricans]|uniref:MazG nucleotide pyrophosphohydrolase domain-containing protein n=1 Tax=Desulfovibrio desulfuricans TaxID=876 RepID=UPI0017814236|nr:MazG nucleotide pyrophosphohydrolase domain-containing protein [Desulfovibrio desulfuricans]MBD8894836.1 nucleotide pyrophosphohydrolase [Desulfovibrio desulfuricans]
MKISEIIDNQKKFDANHSSTFKWDQQITQENLESLEYILLCIVGELGETTNLVKKVLRGDCKLEDVRENISEEVVDMFIYVIKLSYQLGFDIEECYLKKMERNKIRFAKYEINTK